MEKKEIFVIAKEEEQMLIAVYFLTEDVGFIMHSMVNRSDFQRKKV